MRTGAAHDRAGFFHEAGFYSSGTEFRALIVPFIEEGIAAGEPVIVGYDDRRNALVGSWLTDPSAVTFLADASLYATPARAIATYQRQFELHTGMGAEQIRVTGELPHQGNGGRFEGWDRYEAAINTVWEDFPVWALCLYNAATAPAQVLDIAERAHPHIVVPTGKRRRSERYQDISVFEGLPFVPDPLEETVPMVVLVDKSPAEARQMVAQIGRGRVADPILEDLLIAVTEAVRNAQLYGWAPVSVRIWATRGRVVVSVHDSGHGPADPLAGLVPYPSSTARRALGLWLIHQLDIHVTLRHEDDGFTLRLRGGTPMS
jgi:anti-sigma regulatory factor (Ser/Thr protein kinase)